VLRVDKKNCFELLLALVAFFGFAYGVTYAPIAAMDVDGSGRRNRVIALATAICDRMHQSTACGDVEEWLFL
jgi:hypothetical protein